MADYSEHICIVGAGTISNHLAVELVDRGHKVLVIEAGGLEFESGLLGLKNYRFNTPSMLPENVHRVGGGGNFWIGRIGEFLAKDFEALPGIRSESWPIEIGELEPYYRSVYRKLIQNDLLDHEFIEKHFMTSIQVPSGLGIRPIRYTDPQRLLNLFLDKITDPNLVLVKNTIVTNIGMGTDGSSPLVSIENTEGQIADLLVKKVIVACGALQSVKLFLNSTEIQNGANTVSAGNFLMEHLDGYIGNIEVSRQNIKFIKNFALNSDRILESMPTLKCGISIILEPSDKEHVTVGFEIVNKVVNYKFAPATNGLGSHERKRSHAIAFTLERILRKIIGKAAKLLREKIFGLYAFSIWLKAEEIPFQESSVTIDRETGILNYSHKISSETSFAVRQALEKFEFILKSQNLGKVKYYDDVIDASKILRLRPNWHPMGTLRMGSPGNSVVDENLKLHGIENIYFLSSAVFPSGSNQNPVFTTLALGSRLADHISRDASDNL